MRRFGVFLGLAILVASLSTQAAVRPDAETLWSQGLFPCDVTDSKTPIVLRSYLPECKQCESNLAAEREAKNQRIVVEGLGSQFAADLDGLVAATMSLADWVRLKAEDRVAARIGSVVDELLEQLSASQALPKVLQSVADLNLKDKEERRYLELVRKLAWDKTLKRDLSAEETSNSRRQHFLQVASPYFQNRPALEVGQALVGVFRFLSENYAKQCEQPDFFENFNVVAPDAKVREGLLLALQATHTRLVFEEFNYLEKQLVLWRLQQLERAVAFQYCQNMELDTPWVVRVQGFWRIHMAPLYLSLRKRLNASLEGKPERLLSVDGTFLKHAKEQTILSSEKSNRYYYGLLHINDLVKLTRKIRGLEQETPTPKAREEILVLEKRIQDLK